MDTSAGNEDSPAVVLTLQRGRNSLMTFPLIPACAGWLVLVADDDEDSRLLVANALRRAGFAVMEAGNGNDLLKLFGAYYPANPLVVSDVVMPECDGISAAATLRRSSPRTPILLMTGLAGPAVLRDAKAAGADIVLTKPVDLPLLVRSAVSLVEKLVA